MSQWYTGMDTCMLVRWGKPIKSYCPKGTQGRDGQQFCVCICRYHGEIPSSPSVPMVHRDGHTYVSTMGKTHQVLVFQWYTGTGRDGQQFCVCVCWYHGEIPSSPSVPMVHRDGHMYVGTMGKSHQVLVSQW